MSSPKPKARASVNQQVKAGLRAVRDFLSGHSAEAKPAHAEDKDTRELVGAELLAAMSGRNAGEIRADEEREKSGSETRLRSEQDDLQSQLGQGSAVIKNDARSREQEQERARKLFLEHGYFDEAVENLRSAKSASARADAARALGLFGSQRGTPHLIAAMFDEDNQVRIVAEEALAQIGDPTVTEDSVDAVVMQEREESREINLSHAAIHHQVEAPEREPSVQDVAVSPVPSGETAVDITAPLEVETREAFITPAASNDENALAEEEVNLRGALEKLTQQLVETETARKAAEQEIQTRIEQESKLRAEAAERLREEEETRKRVAQEAEARRNQEQQSFAAEQSCTRSS